MATKAGVFALIERLRKDNPDGYDCNGVVVSWDQIVEGLKKHRVSRHLTPNQALRQVALAVH